jgi:hypothetical protein
MVLRKKVNEGMVTDGSNCHRLADTIMAADTLMELEAMAYIADECFMLRYERLKDLKKA